MNKYDDVLNELVYQIDDIVYEFYSRSNDIIASKKAPERLLEYRDQSLNTVNEMNVRSLELISDIKKRELLEERAEKLLEKNHDLVNSILEVLIAAPNKSDLLEDLGEFASKVVDGTKDVIKSVEASETFDKIKSVSSSSIDLAKEKIDEISHDERFIKGKELVKDKTKEAAALSAAALKEGTSKFSSWLKEKSNHDEDSNYEEQNSNDDVNIESSNGE